MELLIYLHTVNLLVALHMRLIIIITIIIIIIIIINITIIIIITIIIYLPTLNGFHIQRGWHVINNGIQQGLYTFILESSTCITIGVDEKSYK